MRAPDTTETEAFWRDGFVVVQGAVTGAQLEQALEAVAAATPDRATVDRDPQTYAAVHASGIFHQAFPFGSSPLDGLVVDEVLIDWSAKQIGTQDLALGDAMMWRKYAGFSDFDQVLHQDYGNNDLVLPRRDGGFLQLTFILYLTEVTAEHGPTFAVPHPAVPAGTPQFLEDRDAYAEVYAAEQPVLAAPGDLLVYETSTFHRGSRMLRPHGERVSVHFQYAAAAHRWTGKVAYGAMGGSPTLTRFLTEATAEQRALVGFPPVDSDYWTPGTIAAVGRRYPGMDLSPYEAAGST